MRDFFHKAPFRVNLIEAWNFALLRKENAPRDTIHNLQKIMRLPGRKQAHKIKWTIQ